jgi:hypothetical protein
MEPGMTKTIETKRNAYGHAVRLQKRGASFDVTYNSNGYYVYGVLADPIVCPSLGMARAKAAL